MTASDILFGVELPCLGAFALIVSIVRHEHFRNWIARRHLGQLVMYCLGMGVIAAFFGMWFRGGVNSAFVPADLWGWLVLGSILIVSVTAAYRFVAALWFWFEARAHN